MRKWKNDIKMTIQKYSERVRSGVRWLRTRTIKDPCKRGNEQSSYSHKGRTICPADILYHLIRRIMHRGHTTVCFKSVTELQRICTQEISGTEVQSRN
jgi:hypothetical protein